MLIFIIGIQNISICDNGYNLWLSYTKLDDKIIKANYNFIQQVYIQSGDSKFIDDNVKNILPSKLSSLLGKKINIATNEANCQLRLYIDKTLTKVNDEGYTIETKHNIVYVKAKSSIGLLYGAFFLLNRLQKQEKLLGLQIVESPKIKLRILNHWDNLDRTVERGYAGFSIINWHELPENIDPRYEDYAMANASIGINGTVVSNVNASAILLRNDYIDKIAALADIYRKYGIKVYITARFSAPIELGKLPTADPLNPQVIQWWSNKVEEIYKKIPDFGGFLVKANSEGQPGPQEYGRNHADGANMLARALKKHNGFVMWRAFVYSHESNVDRFKQAYDEFIKLDGKFDDNVLVQVKNGPIDFQPREPFHPLFGSMPSTPLMLELQITKEYLGQGTHLVGLASMFEEVLAHDTYAKGTGSTVAKIIDGSIHGYKITGIAGVSNIGNAVNWTGNLFGQADWYAFGRLAWNPYLSANTIYDDWIKATFNPKNNKTRGVMLALLENSHEACVQYMTPIGLHHIMAEGHHYGPGPWVDSLFRADWTSVYYHKANVDSIGFDRTINGSNALSQYSIEYQTIYGDINKCPDAYILWFHRIPWNHVLKSGRNVWHELIYQYDQGVSKVETMASQWESIRLYVDPETYRSVHSHLIIQLKEARWWRNACLAYFQSVSGKPYPDDIVPPPYDLAYYKSLTFPYAPGIKPK